MGILKGDVSIEKNVDGECFVDGYYEISEFDFYPPEDDRLYMSGINDVWGGDCFSDFSESFWDLYENEIYD